MNISNSLRIMALPLLLLILLVLASCGGDNTTTSIPIPLDSTAVLNQTYMGETNVLTRIIVGEEIYDGVDCYVTETMAVKPLLRYGLDGEVSHYLLGYTIWTGKSSRLMKKVDFHMETLNGVTGDIQYIYTYGSDDHGAPFSVGKSWTFDIASEGYLLDFPVVTWRTEIVGIEDVTVPAGTFTCYKLESWKESALGTKITPHEVLRTEWWSTGEDFFRSVKSHVDEVTTELVSYSK